MGKGPFVQFKRIGELGNYHPCKIRDLGLEFHSVEQFFQYQKCTTKEDKEMILSCRDPVQCAKLGRKVQLREDWELVKYGVMKLGMRLKFEQHEDLKELLIGTHPHPLFFCEHQAQDEWDNKNQEILTGIRTSYIM